MNGRRVKDAVEKDPLLPAERARSDFVRDLVQRNISSTSGPSSCPGPTPRRIVQFWDDLERLPDDVEACMKSWRKLERDGFELEVFDRDSASNFIRDRLGSRHEQAFARCYHPSMMSDYFRYAYVLVEGGFYIDADDVYHDTSIGHLFDDGRLKLQPFCYDIATSQMVAPSVFTKAGAEQPGWIFYFNTTPMIAARNHPMIERALLNAAASLEADIVNELPEVQATTGPGNLTRSVFEIIREGCSPEALMVAHDWELTSTSQWPLSYHNDARNWRLSNAFGSSNLCEVL
ncbi:glycosyltransferase [Parasphingorhabdus sp. JC815]|uniref:glycosyltransferase family 32 protein n=1 Tax=Parasphingorhabdus sp. JC815 TaxID=3232140 RepID=UPI003458EA69